MRRFWICQWEVTPGNGVQTLQFPTLEEAKLAMRRKIVEHIDLSDYLDKLPLEAAQFISKYLSDPNFPQTPEECPDVFEDLEDLEEDVYGEVIAHSGCIYLNYPCGLAPQLNTNLVLEDDEDDEYRLDFWYDGLWKATHNGISGMSVRIRRGIDYGTSAYPLLVLLALRKEPATQGELINRIAYHWDACIDRKAVGRHLKLLEDMGYPVQHNEKGYYYEGKETAPKPDMKYTPNTYPLMILDMLEEVPQTIDAIAQKIYEQYGVKIDRKAVSRHLELLQALDFKVERTKGGYVITF